MKSSRVFLIVLDSLGIGALPDAARYGDSGSNTLRSISESPEFHIPNLINMGLGMIEGVGLCKTDKPVAAYGRMIEKSAGKDTTTGHFEIAGLISDEPFPVYPDGFPDEIVRKFEKRTGVGILLNKPYSGTEAIKDFGAEHIRSGRIILYTSADSVMQLAAHEEHFGLDRLYKCCETAREIMRGKHNIGRIIARPFTGSEGSFIRTPNRRDYSVEPASDTLLDIMKRSAFDVIGVGKIEDIFAGRGLTASYKTKSNLEGLEVSLKLAKEDFRGLCFVNLVDFDMLYGHRNDIDGYAAAISEFDLWLKGFTDGLNDEDLLIITSDHGCDPGTESTDHSREYTPLLIYNNRLLPKNLKTRKSFADIGKTVAAIYNIDNELDGEVIALEYQ